MIWALTLTIMLATTGCAATAANQQAAKDRHYVNPAYRWAIAYPQDWVLDRQDLTFVKIQPPPHLPKGLLGIHSHTVDFKSVDAFTDAALAFQADAARRRGQEYRVLSRRSLMLSGGIPAVDAVSVLGAGVVGQTRIVCVLVENRGIAIDAETYVNAWQELEPYFDRIINSFVVQP